jgi:hypothetical protein
VQAKDALDNLGLRPGATRAEVKEAYRDLVKVWHPDRFGSDPRLRKKAEDKLRSLNDAYRLLRSGDYELDTMGPTPVSAVAATDAPVEPIVPGRRAEDRRATSGQWWIYGVVGMLVMTFASYAVMEVRSREMRMAAPVTQKSGVVVTEPTAPIEVGSGGAARMPNSGSGDRSATVGLRIRSLSEADTSRVQDACASLKGQQEATAYQTCLKAQLDLVTNVRADDDLSDLSPEERESMESACARERRLKGAPGYDHCVVAQMAELTRDTIRPDFTGVSDADRGSIEAACKGAKTRGPAPYERCRVRLVKLLGESN